MQAEKPKNKRRWSVRILEALIVVAAVVMTIQLFLPDAAPTESIVIQEAEPVVAIPSVENDDGMDAAELYQEARDLKNAGQYEESLALVNLAIEVSEDPDMDYYWFQAWLYGEVAEHEAGIDAYLTLLETAQGRYIAYAHAGLCFNYGSLGDFDNATPFCESSGDYSSHTQFSMNSLCFIHGFTGQYELALEECNSWIAADSHPYAYNNRSHAYLMLGEYEQTIIDATRAIALGTDRPEMPYTNRGLAKIALGQYESGYADLMVAFGADNTYPDIYLGFAQYHDHTGNLNEAQENYCRYLDMAWVTPQDSVLERIDAPGGCG